MNTKITLTVEVDMTVAATIRSAAERAEEIQRNIFACVGKSEDCRIVTDISGTADDRTPF